jgi:heptosyltransferase-1
MNKPKQILIIKTSSLGDIIHTFPVLAYLKARFPDCQIDWVVEKPFLDLVQAHPMVNQVYCIHTKQWRQGWLKWGNMREKIAFRKRLRATHYDVIFDCQGNMKSGLITSLARGNAKVGFDRHCVSEWPNCLFTNRRFAVPMHGNVREENLGLVKAFFNDCEGDSFIDVGVKLNLPVDQQEAVSKLVDHTSKGDYSKKIMVCPGSQWQNKKVTTEALIDFLGLLQKEQNGFFYLIWGSAEEKTAVEQIHEQASLRSHSKIIDKLTLPMLQNMMSYMDLVIAMDSLPLHLAGTAGTPTFSIFGASSATKYKPEGTQHRAIQGPCPYKRTFDRRCPILRTCPTGLCIRGLTGQQLFSRWQKIENS